MSLKVWDYKPKWCQPWSIILTGFMAIGVVWLVTKSLLLTVPVSLLIGFWWFYFLIIYPQAFEKMMQDKNLQVKGNE